MKNYHAIGGVVAVLALPLAASSCGANDSDVVTRDKTGAALYNMPNHFSSIAAKCDGNTHLIFEGDHGESGAGKGGLAVLTDSRSCPPGHTGPPR